MFSNMFNNMLWLGSLACMIAFALTPNDPSNLCLGLVIGSVVITTVAMSYYQNLKSESIMASFKNFLPDYCNVIRDGTHVQGWFPDHILPPTLYRIINLSAPVLPYTFFFLKKNSRRSTGVFLYFILLQYNKKNVKNDI